jgi:hypothetical protein
MATDINIGLLKAVWSKDAVGRLMALAPPNTTFQQRRHPPEVNARHPARECQRQHSHTNSCFIGSTCSNP